MIQFVEGEISEETAYRPKTNLEIKTLALDIVENRVFVTWMLQENEWSHIQTIFLPLIFLNDIQRKQMEIDGITNFYGYYKDSSQMAINGLPIFYAFNVLNRDDSNRVHAAVIEIHEFRKNFLGEK